MMWFDLIWCFDEGGAIRMMHASYIFHFFIAHFCIKEKGWVGRELLFKFPVREDECPAGCKTDEQEVDFGQRE